MKHFTVLSAFVITLGTACASASDLNPLGVYLGAGVGQASNIYDQFSSEGRHDTGWKVMAGVRPIPFVGAELEYLDFGTESFSPANRVGFAGTARARAGGLFAVGYWPILPATMDLFARVGGDRVHTTADGVLECNCFIVRNLSHVGETQSDFAYGGGLQARLGALGLRVEYERTDTAIGHPRLLSAGITYTF
jgi:hypothetical protein